MTTSLLTAENVLTHTPAAAAAVLSRYTEEELTEWLAGCSTRCTVLALRLLPPATAVTMLRTLPLSLREEVLSAMAPRDVFRSLGPFDELRQKILAEVAPNVEREITRILTVDPNTAAALLDGQAIHLLPDSRTSDCVDQIKAVGERIPKTLYVVDADDVLVGRVEIQDLLTSAAEAPIADIVRPVRYSVDEYTGRNEVVRLITRNNLTTVPVVNAQGQLSGVIRAETLFDAVEADASADVQTMVGVSRDEHALSTIWFAVTRRHPWLQINLLTAFLAAAVVGIFESTIAQFTALAVLLPVVAGQSGNTGSQAMAVSMRGLALRQVGVSAWPRLLRKELAAGVINGLGIAVVTAIAVFFWNGGIGLPIIITIAMVVSMAIAGAAGALIPVTLVRLGQDPASSSSIFLTTVTDVVGFFAFLGTATMLSFLL